MKVSVKIKELAYNYLCERYSEELEHCKDNEVKDDLPKAIEYLLNLAEGDYE